MFQRMPSRVWDLQLTVLGMVIFLSVDTHVLVEAEAATRLCVVEGHGTFIKYEHIGHGTTDPNQIAFGRNCPLEGSSVAGILLTRVRGGSGLPRVDPSERAEERKAERKNRSRKQRRKALQLERQAEAAMGKAIRLPNGEVFRPDPEFPMDEELVYLSEPASDPEVGTYYSGPISDVDDVCPEDRPSKAVTVSSGQSIPGFGKPLATPDMQKSIRRLVQDLADAKQVCMGLRQVAHALKVASADFIILAADTDPASILTPVTELCIERELPFVWVSSRKALGAWCGVKASSSCVAVLKDVATHLKGQVSRLHPYTTAARETTFSVQCVTAKVAEVREQIAVLWRYSEPEE